MIQDRGLKILVLYLNDGNSLSLEAKTVIRAIFEKCLVLEKDEVKKNCEEILFWYMDNNFEELLLNELNDNILHKNRKVRFSIFRLNRFLYFLYVLC